jgi:hypothetical protein
MRRVWGLPLHQVQMSSFVPVAKISGINVKISLGLLHDSLVVSTTLTLTHTSTLITMHLTYCLWAPLLKRYVDPAQHQS